MTSLLDAMTRRPRPLTNLAGGDRVVLFPSLGYLSRDQRHWIIDVHGDVSAPGKISLGKRVLLKLLKRAMGAADEEMTSPLFQARIERFVACDRPGRRMAVRICDETFRLVRKSRHNGHFQAAVRIAVGQVREPSPGESAGDDATIPIEVCGSKAAGRAYLLPPTGLSIISDIDDTLKHSQVSCKRTLLTNTFLRPFETIPGMAPLFRHWSDTGAAFHYVSSSPWQLYQHLAEHLESEGFPDGSFHLRPFRLRDHLLRRILMLRRSGKLGVIRGLLKIFPQRRFVLVGDSGEHDPEVYGAVARRHPSQVAGVFIRQLDTRRDEGLRYAHAFRGVDSSLLKLYHAAKDLTGVRIDG
jgi:phosphatidate phosphatase APP1